MNAADVQTARRDLPDQLRQLPAGERLALASALWESLTDDERRASATADEQAWDVIQERLKRLESGDASEVEASEMMARVRRGFGWNSDRTRTVWNEG